MEMFDCCVEENKQTPNVLLLQNSRQFTKNMQINQKISREFLKKSSQTPHQLVKGTISQSYPYILDNKRIQF